MQIPGYIIAILLDEAAGVEAAAQQDRITAAIAPHMSKADRRELVGDLTRKQKQSMVRISPSRPRVEQRDPIKAKEWYLSRGARVHTSEDAHETESRSGLLADNPPGTPDDGPGD